MSDINKESEYVVTVDSLVYRGSQDNDAVATERETQKLFEESIEARQKKQTP